MNRAAARSSCFKQDAERAINLRVGRAFANVKIVEAFFSPIELSLAVEKGGVPLADGLGQLTRTLWDERVAALFFARVEIVRAGRHQFMIIG